MKQSLLPITLALAATVAAEDVVNVRLVTAPSNEYAIEWAGTGRQLHIIPLKSSTETTQLDLPPMAGDSDDFWHVPLPFISPDSNWIFVPSRVIPFDQPFAECASILFHRIETNGGRTHFESAESGRFDQSAWEFLTSELQLKGADTTGDVHRFFSTEFVDWSQDSARLLIQVTSHVYSVSKKEWLHGYAVGSFYCYFNTRSGQFELTDRLQTANRIWESNPFPDKDEEVKSNEVVIDAESVGEEGPQRSPEELFDQADKRLNEVYGKLLAQADGGKQRMLREEERAWIRWRDTDAQVSALQTWSSKWAESRILARKASSTEARVVELQKRLENR